jgi:hypothetical protein
MPFRILIIGAYGQFGRRIAQGLSADPGIALILAGRSIAHAMALRDELAARGACASLSVENIDVDAASLNERLRAIDPDLVIHTAGPFQQRDYRVAEASLACSAHYVDLADGRAFVGGIAALDAAARAQGCWIISGASSVPGLSAAVIAAHAPQFAKLASVESAISPGNRTPRGLATTRAILGYVGQPYRALIDGRWRNVYGWQSLRRTVAPGLVPRWLARCDVPDLDLLPARYPTLRHCDFRAGLELRRMHLGLWLASWAVRYRLASNMRRWARPLLRMSEWWLEAGSDTGLMTVDMRGAGHDRKPLHLQWSIVAEHGSGPRIPATAAVVLARKLARGELPGSGATPCLDLFTLDEFLDMLRDAPIRASTRSLPVSR